MTGAPRTVSELVQALLQMPQDAPVFADAEGEPILLGPVRRAEVVRLPGGRLEYAGAWAALADICHGDGTSSCGMRHCKREGHVPKRAVPVERLGLACIVEGW